MSLRLHLLGTARIERDGQIIELSNAKSIALLAYLAVTPVAPSREHLIALLWSSSTEEAARKNLRNTLWILRRSLGENIITPNSEQLALTNDLWCDVCELQANSESPGSITPPLEEWPVGVFLDSLNLSDAPEYEFWLTTTRERLSQTYLRALSILMEQYQSQNEWGRLLGLARKALVLDNLQEQVYRQMMLSYAQMGQRAEALRTYDRLKQVLNDELGVDPLPETESLRATVLNGSITPAVLPTVTQSRRSKRLPILGENPQTPYIGRTSELGMLNRAFTTAQAGHLQIALITGEMGIGKSRLWQEWSVSLPPDAVVLEARCLEATQNLPFAPMAELFSNSPHLKQRIREMSTSRLTPLWLGELARVVPSIQMAVPQITIPSALPIDEERRRIFESFTQLIISLPDRPVIMFADDVHWADSATLNWLSYLTNRMRHDALLLVIAYRPEDAPTMLIRLMADWGREHSLLKMPLKRLDDKESSDLVRGLVDDSQQVQRLVKESNGNPLFLIELCRAWPSDKPAALSDLIRARLERLNNSERQVLQAAAILEPDFDFPTLRRASGRGEEETLDALDTLLNSSILLEHSGQYSFAHPFVAELVRADLSTARRAYLHRRSSEALAVSYAGKLDTVAARLAYHYGEANEPALAAQYAEMAAQHALALAAPTEAINFFRQAYAFDPSPRRKLQLGIALERANELVEARAILEETLREYEGLGNSQQAVEVCLELANVSLVSGRYDDTLHWAHHATRHLSDNSLPRQRVLGEFLLGVGTMQGGAALEEAEQHLRNAIRIANASDLSEMSGLGQFELGNLLAQRGELELALKAYGESIRIAEQTGNVMLQVLGHNNYAYHAMLLGKLDDAHKHIETGFTLLQTSALQTLMQYLYSTRGEIALAEQQWDEADTWFTKGMAETEKTGNAVQAANYIANMGLAAQGRGDLDAALSLLETASRRVGLLLAPFLQIQIDLWLSQLYIQRRELVAAEQTLQRAQNRMFEKSYSHLRVVADQLKEDIRSKS